jgi:hypothetical protein
MIKIRDHMISERIRCAICHSDIDNQTMVFQSTVNYGIICPKCIKLFKKEDIEIALNLFFLYGGYFGQYKRAEFSIIERLVALVEEEGESFNFEITNMKLLHEALIHGITPEEFNHSLEVFLKE